MMHHQHNIQAMNVVNGGNDLLLAQQKLANMLHDASMSQTNRLVLNNINLNAWNQLQMQQQQQQAKLLKHISSMDYQDRANAAALQLLYQHQQNEAAAALNQHGPAGTPMNNSQAAAAAAAAAVAATRYKTELCRSFQENGTCKYGDKCQFAHGGHELRNMMRHPKYKTELCRTFHAAGYCPYGPRCHFVHDTNVEAVQAQRMQAPQMIHHQQQHQQQMPVQQAPVNMFPHHADYFNMLNSQRNNVTSTNSSASSTYHSPKMAASSVTKQNELLVAAALALKLQNQNGGATVPLSSLTLPSSSCSSSSSSVSGYNTRGGQQLNYMSSSSNNSSSSTSPLSTFTNTNVFTFNQLPSQLETMSLSGPSSSANSTNSLLMCAANSNDGCDSPFSSLVDSTLISHSSGVICKPTRKESTSSSSSAECGSNLSPPSSRSLSPDAVSTSSRSSSSSSASSVNNDYSSSLFNLSTILSNLNLASEQAQPADNNNGVLNYISLATSNLSL